MLCALLTPGYAACLVLVSQFPLQQAVAMIAHGDVVGVAKIRDDDFARSAVPTEHPTTVTTVVFPFHHGESHFAVKTILGGGVRHPR